MDVGDHCVEMKLTHHFGFQLFPLLLNQRRKALDEEKREKESINMADGCS
jgi:hypothetical protein